MDNITHTLTAVALSQAGLNRKTRFATLTLVLGANLPDIDFVSLLGGAATCLKYHRGITHSILGGAVLASLLGAAVYFLGRRSAPKKAAPPLDLRWLLAAAWIAVGSHILMDFTNSYGIRPFLPFSGHWYAWDIMFIVDPLLLVLLAAGLTLPALFRLITEEVGAKKTGFRGGAIFGLCAMLALWGIRDLAHRRVMGFLNSHTYDQEDPIRIGAFPGPLNPFSWTGVVETDSAFRMLTASALDSDVDAEHTITFHKPESTPALDAALKTRTAAILEDFARFPWANVETTDEGFDVTIQDLRFTSTATQARVFAADVKLDKDLRVVSQSFHFMPRDRQ